MALAFWLLYHGNCKDSSGFEGPSPQVSLSFLVFLKKKEISEQKERKRKRKLRT